MDKERYFTVTVEYGQDQATVKTILYLNIDGYKNNHISINHIREKLNIRQNFAVLFLYEFKTKEDYLAYIGE